MAVIGALALASTTTLSAVEASVPPPIIICTPPPPPPPTGSPWPSPSSSLTTPLSLGVSWPAVPGAELYDVHVSLGGAWDPFLSVTSAVPEALIQDLQPATAYSLAVRSRGPKPAAWTAIGELASCTTAGDSLTANLIRPPRGPAQPDAIVVGFTEAAPAPVPGSRWTLNYRSRVANHESTTEVPPGALNQTITGLNESTAYDVWLSVSLAPWGRAGPQSPIVVHRTSSHATSSFEVFRISELCGDGCQPDMLGEHDSGDLLSDVDFITHVAASGSTSHFNISFNSSIVTRYCVERRVPPADDWADYLSCNGPTTTNYTCACNNWIDRCIGRLDISSCDTTGPWHGFPVCRCSAASLSRSFAEVGRMPVYAPFPQLSPPPPDWDCTKTTPPPSKSHYLGSWYSTPAAAACPPGTSPAADAGQQGSCSWARRASQHFVLGRDLHALGFNTSGAADYPELVHNRQVLQKAFERHPARCCGC